MLHLPTHRRYDLWRRQHQTHHRLLRGVNGRWPGGSVISPCNERICVRGRRLHTQTAACSTHPLAACTPAQGHSYPWWACAPCVRCNVQFPMDGCYLRRDPPSNPALPCNLGPAIIHCHRGPGIATKGKARHVDVPVIVHSARIKASDTAHRQSCCGYREAMPRSRFCHNGPVREPPFPSRGCWPKACGRRPWQCSVELVCSEDLRCVPEAVE